MPYLIAIYTKDEVITYLNAIHAEDKVMDTISTEDGVKDTVSNCCLLKMSLWMTYLSNCYGR